ncbi:hypothetical protein RM437_06515 [Citrobacter werkmanii]|uniref:hypothetical protein n=1 Tax=Citrobacter werkmanii TaxID=67827 RepID=UPI002887F846|nr:hypothetical protein [Citrobacter werkmanii]MDT0637685.1 hypothetical protein [Citrobacter werkmanii]
MNMKKIKAVKEAIGMMNSVSGTIAQAIVHVNLTSTDAPLITGKFNRRAALAAELVNVLAALEAQQGNNDTREWCGNDIEAAHAEALGMNVQRDFYLSPAWRRQLVETAHREALKINTQVNEELCKLARVIAGVNRSTYKHETKAQLIGAACAGVVDGLRERVGVVLSRDRLAETVTRAVVARNE